LPTALYRAGSTLAWWLTIWLLCAGILLSLLKGFDYEEATVLGLVVIVPGIGPAAAFCRPHVP